MTLRPAVLLLCAAAPLAAQSSNPSTPRVVATVPASDITGSSGVLEVSSGRSVLGGNSSVTAGPLLPAHVTLLRGGELEVCQGSTARLTVSGPDTGKRSPMVVGLDRGALELRMNLTPADAVMTPDLRIAGADGNNHPLDLALRVTAAGDTCIDNRGRKAAPINVSSAFNTGTYQIKPGQRVLFERGSLREVVDREQGPCGCPTPEQVAANGKDKSGKYPFPEAVADGLVPPGSAPPEASGVTHTSVSTTLAADPGTNLGTDPPPAVVQPAASTGTPSPSTHQPGFFASIGNFFKRIFAR